MRKHEHDARRLERDRRSQELLQQAQDADDGEESARLRDQVVLENRPLALGLARRFDHRGMEREDLQQVAMVGLVEAVERYRPGAGASFAAFAVPTIRGVLKRHFRDHGWSVRPPRALQDLHGQVRSCTLELQQELGREPTDAAVADRVGVSVAQVRCARSVEQHYRSSSLDAPTGPGSGTMLKDTITADEDPQDDAVAFVLLRDALGELNPQERSLLAMRFYEDLTQREIGARLRVSQMQVSRLLSRIFTRMRQKLTLDEELRHAG